MNSDSQTDQYSEQSLRRYEAVFGADFVSTGGIETTAHYCRSLGLNSESRVLDIGSGLGGSAFHMNNTYGASVLGIDILQRMVDMASDRARTRGLSDVEFRRGDITEMDYEEEAFDLVYSRDALLYIDNKASLFRELYEWIAPGGQVFITDYCTGSGQLSQRYADYQIDTGYHLLPVADYGGLLEDAGFVEIQAVDETARFIEILQENLATLRDSKTSEKLEPSDIDYLIRRWEMKVAFCRNDDMKWGRFQARRP